MRDGRKDNIFRKRNLKNILNVAKSSKKEQFCKISLYNIDGSYILNEAWAHWALVQWPSTIYLFFLNLIQLIAYSILAINHLKWVYFANKLITNFTKTKIEIIQISFKVTHE